MRTLLLAAVLAAPGLCGTWWVTVAGLGGEPDYAQRFESWAREIDKTMRAAPDAHLETLYSAAATKPAVRTALESVARQAGQQDAFVLMLIGHGTWDGVDYRFNLPGPDITASELAALLERIPAARQLVVNATSASGGSLDALIRPGRIVVTATKTGTEKNATVFARYWVEALRDPAADTDKNEVISAEEAFKYATQKTAKFYEGQQRLATEHARLEGEAANSFVLVRFGQASAAMKDPAKRGLLARREELEQRIDLLKLRKAAMPAEEYWKQLTALLLELAKTQEELDK
jgi:hypothetical protein